MPTLGLRSSQRNGVKRDRSMKPSSRDQQLGLASPLNCAAIQSGKPKTPLRRRRRGQGLDASHTAFREGRGENFLLTSLSQDERYRLWVLENSFWSFVWEIGS
jgi:hypothetical protein